MDDRLRQAERLYAARPSIETLRRFNSERGRADQEAFLPLEHLQMLFEDMILLLDGATVDDSGPGAGLVEQGVDNFRVVQGRYGHPYGNQVSPVTHEPIFTWTQFRVTAYNVFGDEHRNAHLTIKKEGIYRNQTEGHELDIFTDDVIYGGWHCDPQRSFSASNHERHTLHQFTLDLNQPWVYSARGILDFCLKHWDEVRDQRSTINVRRNPYRRNGMFDPHPANITVERRANRAQQRLDAIARRYAFNGEIESDVRPESEFQCWEVEITFNFDEEGGVPVSVLIRWPYWEYTQTRPAFLEAEGIKEHRLEPPHGWVNWGVPYFTQMDAPVGHPYYEFIREIDEAVLGKTDISYRYTEYRPGDA